jgi:hypothetical protein
MGPTLCTMGDLLAGVNVSDMPMACVTNTWAAHAAKTFLTECNCMAIDNCCVS